MPPPARLARKYQRRERRIARWRQPLTTRGRRLRAWLSMLLADHGVLRFVFPNRHKVSDKLWRSAQPLPRDIAWAAQNGIRTVINLRGGREFGCWPLEREACERHGIRLIDMPLHARGVPRVEAIRWARELFDTIAYPALMHCKSGADRTGLAAALYLLLHEKRPLGEATAQLHRRFGHLRSTATGVLDAFFEAYARDAEAAAARGAELDFLDWVERIYDPAALRASFVPASRLTRARMRWQNWRLGLPRAAQAARRSPD
ncbi:MAG TPA: tyrosine-protein phosphatase [Beijerinckiaceae bacterium]|nr:tyrosine-protein phosphatase [Beijerinckiaceae bacterium]